MPSTREGRRNTGLMRLLEGAPVCRAADKEDIVRRQRVANPRRGHQTPASGGGRQRQRPDHHREQRGDVHVTRGRRLRGAEPAPHDGDGDKQREQAGQRAPDDGRDRSAASRGHPCDPRGSDHQPGHLVHPHGPSDTTGDPSDDDQGHGDHIRWRNIIATEPTPHQPPHHEHADRQREPGHTPRPPRDQHRAYGRDEGKPDPRGGDRRQEQHCGDDRAVQRHMEGGEAEQCRQQPAHLERPDQILVPGAEDPGECDDDEPATWPCVRRHQHIQA